MTRTLPPLNLPEGAILLITDELAAPADFILHRALADHLKSSRDESSEIPGTAVVLSISESLSRWKALASKSNIRLQNHIDNGSMCFIDARSDSIDDGSNLPDQRLRDLFSSISDKLNNSSSAECLLIIDDISSFNWLGCPMPQLHNFLRATRAMCLQRGVTFFIRHHLLSSDDLETDDLYRFLLQACTHHLGVRALTSGRSGAVTGEITLHRGFSAPLLDDVRLIPRHSALQYNLTDSGPNFFAKGTSGGVL